SHANGSVRGGITNTVANAMARPKRDSEKISFALILTRIPDLDGMRSAEVNAQRVRPCGAGQTMMRGPAAPAAPSNAPHSSLPPRSAWPPRAGAGREAPFVAAPRDPSRAARPEPLGETIQAGPRPEVAFSQSGP